MILCLGVFATLICSVIACTPSRLARYPDNALRVPYEEATSHSTCLVASVAMAGNYLLGDRRFTEMSIRNDLKQAGLDETRVADIKEYLNKQGLHLVTLSGSVDGKPPASLRYWVTQRGYPAICIINRHDNNPNFNHAVVAVGFSANKDVEKADTIHYLDPSSAMMLHTEEMPAFETLWARGQHAMMIVIAVPAKDAE